MNEPKCAVCGNTPAFVCNSRFGAYSNAYCQECLRRDAEPAGDCQMAIDMGLELSDVAHITTFADGYYLPFGELLAKQAANQD